MELVLVSSLKEGGKEDDEGSEDEIDEASAGAVVGLGELDIEVVNRWKGVEGVGGGETVDAVITGILDT